MSVHCASTLYVSVGVEVVGRGVGEFTAMSWCSGSMKMGNIVPRAGIKPTSPTFQASI